MISKWLGTTLLLLAAAAHADPSNVPSDSAKPSVLDGVLHDNGPAAEVSTSDLRLALEHGSAIVLDARPYDEYAVSHIPGARTVPGKPGTTPALYVADVTWVEKNIANKLQPLIAYCNGLNCGRSKRFADELIKAGYSNVRRYQLGAPAWRSLGGVMQVEKDAMLRLLQQDATAVLVDAREEQGAAPKLNHAQWIREADAEKAKDDGRLPMTDHNTRIFVVGDTAEQARKVAEAIVHDAFHNVSFYGGSITGLPAL
jgi:rhodanese-related sulfurtransferase